MSDLGYCPRCEQDTIPDARTGLCLWCDTPTVPHEPERAHEDRKRRAAQ